MHRRDPFDNAMAARSIACKLSRKRRRGRGPSRREPGLAHRRKGHRCGGERDRSAPYVALMVMTFFGIGATLSASSETITSYDPMGVVAGTVTLQVTVV